MRELTDESGSVVTIGGVFASNHEWRIEESEPNKMSLPVSRFKIVYERDFSFKFCFNFPFGSQFSNVFLMDFVSLI